jgi:hypothetical protein
MGLFLVPPASFEKRQTRVGHRAGVQTMVMVEKCNSTISRSGIASCQRPVPGIKAHSDTPWTRWEATRR